MFGVRTPFWLVESSKPYTYVRLYRVAAKACPTSKRSLADIAACSKEHNASGVGLEIGTSSATCTSGFCFIHGSKCPKCTQQDAIRKARTDVARAIAKRFKLTLWRDAATNLYRPAYLHVHRGTLGKEHLRLARRARDAAAVMLHRLGYEVRVTTDEGGTKVLPLKKPHRRTRTGDAR